MKSRSHGSIPGTWSGGRQLMSRARTPDLVQAPGGAAELVALGAAPVLAEDAAHAVATAAEARPHRDAGGHERLDGGQRELVADQRDGLQQDEVGRMVLEGARQQLDELAPGGAVDVAVDARRRGRPRPCARPARSPRARSRRRRRAMSIQCSGARCPVRWDCISAVRPQVLVEMTSQPCST